MSVVDFLLSKLGKTTAQAGPQQTNPPVGSSLNVTTTGVAAKLPVEGIHAATTDIASYLASDESEWIKYLGHALRVYRKPGVTLTEEYHQWLAARARSRVIVSAVD